MLKCQKMHHFSTFQSSIPDDASITKNNRALTLYAIINTCTQDGLTRPRVAARELFQPTPLHKEFEPLWRSATFVGAFKSSWNRALKCTVYTFPEYSIALD